MMAGSVLIGATLAWQSGSLTALNEASDVVNPGGRLHDDFNGENKDIYVENFADEDIFARIRLGEYFAIINNYVPDNPDAPLSAVHELAGTRTETENGTVTYSYAIHYFDRANATDLYWNWETGGETVYMPTFNRNKDSLIPDLNGTYQPGEGVISKRDGDQYAGYVKYRMGDKISGTEIYDSDTNDIDEVGDDFERLGNYADHIVIVENVIHEAVRTYSAKLMGLAEWKTLPETEKTGPYWVYDNDGWVYWAQPIKPHTATGLLLDAISLRGAMDDTWYYAIEVTAQFITADDLGKRDQTGFYDAEKGSAPSADALSLLETIGVDVSDG